LRRSRSQSPLIRERLQQRNLALGELSSVGSCKRDRSNGVAVKQQRHCHDASIGYRLGENQGTVGGILTNLMVYVNRRLLGQQRDKLYREALRMELAAAGEDLKKLREIAATACGRPSYAICNGRRLNWPPAGYTSAGRRTARRVSTRCNDNEDLVVDYSKIKTNGNGNGHG
jgi:hypothetical protein